MNPEYRELDGLSQSQLKIFARSPELFERRFISKKAPEPSPTDAQVMGLRAEAFIRGENETPQIIPNDVLTSNGARRGKKWDAWLKEQTEAGWDESLLMTKKEHEKECGSFETIRDHVQGDAYANWLLCGSDGVWHDRRNWECPLTGIKRKGEVDRLVHGEDGRKGIVCDLKLMKDPTPAAFEADVSRYGYDVQAWTYLQGWEDVADSYAFVAIRNEEPFDVWCYELPEYWIEEAGEWCVPHLERYKTAIKQGIWAHPRRNRITMLSKPKFADVNRERMEKQYSIVDSEAS